jgi:UDP-sulfoquinovose synthase
MNCGTVLLLGSEGYIGHALRLRLLNKGYRVIGVDNNSRETNVKSIGSFSATDIENRQSQINMYGDNFILYEFSINNEYEFLLNLVRGFQPHTIVNLAQQPSAPFSHISRAHTIESIRNNEDGTLNCLYAIKESDKNIHLIQIGSMGEYDQSMGVDIQEGVFDFEHNGRVAKNVIYPRRSPSFYHSSKISSTYFIDLAVRCWDISATDIMQGVVYGNWTPEIESTGMDTRLDGDEAFGTVLNRFIIQALINYPLTVYGNGMHRRGFLSLNDSIQCLMIAIENRPNKGEYRTWNQLDEPWRMVDLAYKVKEVFNKNGYTNVDIKNIPSPRVECTDDFYYNPITEKLTSLGFKPTRTVENEIEYDISILRDKDLRSLESVVMPKTMWRE